MSIRQRPQYSQRIKTRINSAIYAREMRVIGAEGENLGVLSREDALAAAEAANLDLIEISPKANPPVAKIMDYGQYRYETKRKASAVKASSHTTETKTIQVKIGTGEHDQMLKAKRVAEWLDQGHRVKIDLFLWGRYKYMDQAFLKERLERFLKVIPAEYKLADEIKKSPKGFTTVIERTGSSNVKNRISAQSQKKFDTENETPTTQNAIATKSKKKSLEDLMDLGLS